MANMIVQVGQDRYRCRYCGQMLRTNEVDNHKDMHTNPFKCPRCGKNFSNKKMLKDHYLSIHHEGDRPRCQICKKSFSGKAALIMHRREVHLPPAIIISIKRSRQGSKRSYRCGKCNTEFSRIAALKNHKEWKHPKCDVCGKEFSKKKLMTRHKKRKHPTCDVCGRAFTKRAALNKHKWINHQDNMGSQHPANDSEVADKENQCPGNDSNVEDKENQNPGIGSEVEDTQNQYPGHESEVEDKDKQHPENDCKTDDNQDTVMKLKESNPK